MADNSKSSSLEVGVTDHLTIGEVETTEEEAEEVSEIETIEVQEEISEIDHKEEILEIDQEVALIVEKKDT